MVRTMDDLRCQRINRKRAETTTNHMAPRDATVSTATVSWRFMGQNPTKTDQPRHTSRVLLTMRPVEVNVVPNII